MLARDPKRWLSFVILALVGAWGIGSDTELPSSVPVVTAEAVTPEARQPEPIAADPMETSRYREITPEPALPVYIGGRVEDVARNPIAVTAVRLIPAGGTPAEWQAMVLPGRPDDARPTSGDGTFRVVVPDAMQESLHVAVHAKGGWWMVENCRGGLEDLVLVLPGPPTTPAPPVPAHERYQVSSKIPEGIYTCGRGQRNAPAPAGGVKRKLTKKIVPVIAKGGLPHRDDHARLRRCLDELEETQRDVMRSAFFTGRTYAEIADGLEKPLGTVKSWVRRSLIKLRACLDGPVGENAE